ncbi:adenosylcobinamide-phosphate synthase CbiB [Thiocystis violascens]|uniref:Cobalamin biosynthesis protein CobD n=1 Tax=Thiocystis violascens (strain ATCC 17096 / DSM 198 / 6111) TaxID=765911 RepID=I3Y9I1_THIV6|nr:adenosylcobinamide-phosphate synthase CbiB [Thiocystis violascens]AFL73649.1 cobalamin biosynthesis protein CobD [Thiocystis violascens DSM 198]
MTEHLALILAACLLDVALGDPVYRWHPIRLVGDLILAGERLFFAVGLNGRLGGVLHWLLTVACALGVWFGIRAGLGLVHPWLAFLWDLYIAYSLLCLRGLVEQGWRVLRDLEDLPAAREHMKMLVGRDTEPLKRDGIVRATIESLSENLTDAVLTPLWALCLFGLPGLILVKVVSTLDSMVGYRTSRYERFGWAGARSDDLVHWLPARLSVLLIATAAALLRLHPWLALRSPWRYRRLLPSPNSGWSEAACAGALRVRLLGPVWRDGQLINREVFMGDPNWPADLGAEDLRRALTLIALCCLFAMVLGLVIASYRFPMPW